MKLKWQCSEGHEFEAPSHRVKHGHWCKKCAVSAVAKSQRLTIEEMKKLAEKRGGKCLSTEYVNNNLKLKWQCSEGHEWEATPHSMKHGSWCLICSGYAIKSIEDMRKLAEKRGGKCLSDTYTNSQTKLRWLCANGHEWEARPGDVKRGKWCRKCANTELLTIEEMRQLAAKRGGKCLSDTYINSKTKLRWLCAHGHDWEATPLNVKQGHWCRKCYDSNRGKNRIK